MPELQSLTLEMPNDIENLKLPSPGLVQYYKDDSNRIIWIEGEITDAIMDDYKRILEWNNYDNDHNIDIEHRTPIKIFINSNGGFLDETMALISLIELSKTPVYTIDACNCFSAAGLLLMAGHRRFAMPRSKCLIHSGSTSGMTGTFEQTQAAMDDYKNIVAQMHEYILSKTNIEKKILNKRKTYDWYINTEEMLTYGIIDEIVDDIDILL